ncbi:hypothetical protein D3C84_1220890 [compost metagenome]
MALAHGIAEFGTETLEARGLKEERLHLRRLALDDLFQQVFPDQAFVAPGALLHAAAAKRVLTGEQPQA